jgi:putative hemolysin
MSATSLILVAGIVLSIALSGFFSGAETGVVSVSRVHLRHLIRSGNKRAQRLSKLLFRQEGVIATTLVGTNIFNVAAASLATVLVERSVGAAAPVVSTAVVAPIVLIFAEVIPKTYFRFRADTAMLSVCGAVAAATRLLGPLARLTSVFVGAILRVTGRKERSFFVTREELKSVVRESAETGALRLRERDMLHAVFDFGRATAGEAMIPLDKTISISQDAGADELKELVRSRGHTRIPVYRGRHDQVVGFVNIFDVLYSETPDAGIEEHVRPIRSVQIKKRLDILLIELLRARTPIAAVQNEQGQCAGIVTVEDIVEEIMGELTDEHDSFIR